MNAPPLACPPSAPRVSVVMPAYNARPFIEEAVRSVLQQDYTQLELIVIDDGSTDGTAEAVPRDDPRVRLLRQSNAGPAVARNRGIAAARGEFIAFLDADDVWRAGKLSMQVRHLLAHPEVGVVFGSFIHWQANAQGVFSSPPPPLKPDHPERQVPERSGWIYPNMLLDSVICIITAMVRRSVIESVGLFDENLITGEDYDFWLRVSHQFQASQLDATVAYYRMHHSSTTKVPRRDNNEYKVLLNALATYGPASPAQAGASAPALRQRFFRLCFSHGYFHIRRGDPQVAQAAFAAALQHVPLAPKVWVYWLLASGKRLLRAGVRTP